MWGLFLLMGWRDGRSPTGVTHRGRPAQSWALLQGLPVSETYGEGPTPLLPFWDHPHLTMLATRGVCGSFPPPFFSIELRELERKLRSAYMNKERAAQIAEREAQKFEQMVMSSVGCRGLGNLTWGFVRWPPLACLHHLLCKAQNLNKTHGFGDVSSVGAPKPILSA